MFSVHYCLFVILLLFVTSSKGVALFRDIFKREASEGSSGKCGKVDPLIAVKTDVKSFTSPDFPNNYPVDLDLCSWRIRTNQGNQVIVSFLSMDVEPQRNCQYDYLVLYDGPDASSPKVGQYCGTKLPQAFTSTTSEVFVTFHSDEADSFKGFEIGYQATGEFDDLVIESADEDDTEVSGDSIGEDSSAKPLIGGGEEDHTEGPDAENEFSGEKSEEDADSQFVEEVGDCNQIWHNARQGNITSPGYPDQYPSNKDCTIEINAPINRRIDLTFSFFDLEDVPCIFDYVIIKNSSAEDADVGQYCGNNVPGLIQSFTRQLIIKFVSDSADQRGGFSASFTTQESELVNNGLSKQPDADSVLEFIIQPMNSLDLQVGDLVEKECEVNKEGAVFSWLKDDNLLPEGKATEGIVIGDDGKTLVIPSMEEKHQGDFVCKAHLPGGPLIIAPFSLRVTDEDSYSESVPNYEDSADSIPEDESEEDSELFATVPMAANISEGANHVFFCSTNAVVDLYWEKDGRHLDLNARIYEIFEANLIVSDARMADSGMYSCAAYSKRHSNQKLGEASAYLSVTSGLEVSNESELVNNGLSKQPDGDRVLEFIIQPMHSLDLQVGDLVEKECEVNKEGAVFSWLKDDNLLPEGKATEGIVIDDDGKTLVIPRMEEKHQGDFVCKAHLPGGPLIIAPFSLRVTDEAFYSDSVLSYDYSADSSPEDESEEDSELFATVPMAANISEGANHVFFCSTNAVVDLYWEKDGRHLDLNARIYEIFEANLIVSDARMADSGMYSCAAYSKTHSDKKLGVASAYLSVTSGLEVSNVCGTVRAQGVVADESTEEDKGKIVNGQTALKGSSPWIARLWRRSNMEPFCGGSLINYRWVVTAANCFKGISRPEHLEVRLGDHDTLLIEPEEIRMQVSRYILHPDYNPVTLDSDIALIELESRVQSFTNYITPICLPNVRTSDELLVPGETAHVAGWGQIIENGAYPRYLKELNIPIVLQRSCKESTEVYVSDNMFCAGYSQALKGDTCQGDSGGPLAQEMDGKWYMTGICSWGEGCAREGKYGFYTKVVQFIDWLTESMTS
ncbi:uncharacterized protein [Asterias amurensis]|uniref:uncharacterized protein isoform X2 n=1 Tax=Asterias amurensis TaxID=7602 RepID=UPI003AB1A736